MAFGVPLPHVSCARMPRPVVGHVFQPPLRSSPAFSHCVHCPQRNGFAMRVAAPSPSRVYPCASSISPNSCRIHPPPRSFQRRPLLGLAGLRMLQRNPAMACCTVSSGYCSSILATSSSNSGTSASRKWCIRYSFLAPVPTRAVWRSSADGVGEGARFWGPKPHQRARARPLLCCVCHGYSSPHVTPVS